MPPKYVTTIREEIFYEYAKLMSRTVFTGTLNYGFISDRFKALRDGQITMSGTNREWQREQELPRECVFCGSVRELQIDHLIPRNRGGSDSADNMVWSWKDGDVHKYISFSQKSACVARGRRTVSYP